MDSEKIKIVILKAFFDIFSHFSSKMSHFEVFGVHAFGLASMRQPNGPRNGRDQKSEGKVEAQFLSKNAYFIDFLCFFPHFSLVTITRHFHGWEISSLPAAVALLTQKWRNSGYSGPLDLRESLVLVPTRHAGRRLRAELARVAADNGSAVLLDGIVTPEHLIPLPLDAASDDLSLTLLAKRLWKHHDDFAFLLPDQSGCWSFRFALGIAVQLQEVRRQLNEAHQTAAELIPKVPKEERERWQDFSRLEQGLIQEIEELGLQDSLHSRLNAAQQVPKVFPFSRILSLFVPDLSGLAAQTLRTLSSVSEVELHILAPESEADRFDDWGRPRSEAWEQEPLPIPADQIHVYAQSGDETEALVELAVKAEDQKCALTLCTPDPASAQALARRMQAEGHHIYLPNGIPLSTTAPGHLLTDWLTLQQQQDYASVAAFLRNPDAQDWLLTADGLDDITALLTELDDCQNRHLPSSFAELLRVTRDNPRTENLARALDAIQLSLPLPLAEFLSRLYDCRAPSADNPDNAGFADAAQGVAQLVADVQDTADRTGLSTDEAQALLRVLLPLQQIFPKPNTADAREALGWLEIQWETAPAVILSDMREGVIPETRIGDAFLPDSIRIQAGLTGNRDALARDLYLTQTLLASRPDNGIHFLTSRRAASQDPQLPSRILTACPDSELPARVSLLFEEPALHGPEVATSQSELILTPPDCPPDRIPRKLSVTGFKSYLACPFRFYLGAVLGMDALDDSSHELNAMHFGTLAHEVLDLLSQHPNLADEHQIRDLLLEELDRRFARRFGTRPSLVLTVQLNSLRQRLIAAAREQARSVEEGWRITSGEEKYTAELDGMSIHGRIDRIEQHADGRIRILDYKTSDRGIAPIKAHYQPGNQVWLDLQLPLYRFMYADRYPEAPVAEVGYFNLPKAVANTRIRLMDFSGKDGDLYEPAIQTARQVVKEVQAGIFWPPASVNPQWDAYAALAPNPPCRVREVPPQ